MTRSVWLLSAIVLSLVLSWSMPHADAMKRRKSAGVVILIKANQVVRKIPPGAVGWGAMWKSSTLWPPPPKKFDDRSHAEYIRKLAAANLPLVRQADLRHISWPWGVTFSTFGVNWENSVGPWSRRKLDCVRGSGWCEKAIVGVEDLLTLAEIWELEAVTVAVPLAVFDRNRKLWGPRLFHDDFTDDAIERISDHALQLVRLMKRHRGWKSLRRVYVAAGCEWRKYRLRNPSSAVLTYARLVKRIREKIPDKKVWIVASASDGADIPGRELLKATSWNRYLYERLKNTSGVAFDLHRYRGMIGMDAGKNRRLSMTPANIDRLLNVGLTQRGYLTVHPGQWGQRGKPMTSILLENAIHGIDADHRKHSQEPRPWPVVMAHADLVREALASEALAFLGWTWFPETLPPEWPHGAILDGQLAPHARAQAFLSEYHRGVLLKTVGGDTGPIRGNATRDVRGRIHAYGGNFSRDQQALTFSLGGTRLRGGDVELLSKTGTQRIRWDGRTRLELAPMTLWRIVFK